MNSEFVEKNFKLFLDKAVVVVTCLVILLIGLKVIKFITKKANTLMNAKEVDPSIVKFTTSLIGITLKILLVLSVLKTAGQDVTSFVAILGAASFAVGMALQGSLSNFAAGVLILILRPFKVDDFVEVSGESGVVTSIQVFSTVLTTPDKKTIIIPNAAIIGSNITNYSVEKLRRVDFTFGIDYSADIKLAKEVMFDVVNKNELVLKDPDIFVGVSELADSSVNFAVRAWVESKDYWTVYFEVMEAMKLRLDKEKISIPYPHIQIVKD